VVFSVILHVSFLFGFNRPTVKKVQVQEEKTTVIQMEMPPLEPEKPDKVEESSEEPIANVMAPPSLVDLPTVVPVNAFTQPIQPPPPPGIQATGTVTIPVNRPSSFGAGMKDLFDLANLDQIPQARIQVKPVYPFEMRRAGITGEVTVAFIVTSTGDVVEAYAAKSTQREFEAPAVAAVSKWKFKPGRKGGRAVNTKMLVPIVFSITDDE
jgi:protein TonB